MEDLRQRFRTALDRLGWEILAEAYEHAREGQEPSRRTLYRKTGLRWAGAKEWAATGNLPTPDEPDETNRFAAILAENQRLGKSLSRAKDISQAIIDCCMTEIAKLKIAPVQIPRRENSTENLEFHLMRSDAQVGQYTDARWVQGVSRYDSQIYECRVNKLAEKVSLFREQDHRSLGLNKLVVYHLGDQVEGEGIFKGQPFAIDLPGVEQLFHSLRVEAGFILFLASIFPAVELFCVPGNHGRPGRKGDNHPKTNFDYVFYRLLQMTLERQENVKVYVSESPSMLVRQGEFNCLLNHGDNATSWNGIPYYGLDRVAKRVHELYGMVINYNFCGHHHTPCNLADRVIMNGCLPGGSDFSVNRLTVATRPSQKIFYFHPDHGINRESNLYLAELVRMEADENGIFTAYV